MWSLQESSSRRSDECPDRVFAISEKAFIITLLSSIILYHLRDAGSHHPAVLFGVGHRQRDVEVVVNCELVSQNVIVV